MELTIFFQTVRWLFRPLSPFFLSSKMRISAFLRYHCMRISDAIDSFVQYISSERRLSRLTVEEYASVLASFYAFLDEKFQLSDIEDVSHLEVREWQMHLADQGIVASSLKTKLVVLRSFFKFLRREGVVDADIMAKVTTPKTPRHLPVFFTESETAKIYDPTNFDDSFDGKRDQLLLRLLYETGIRRAEVLGLKESSVDFGAKTLKVLGKRDKERIIPLENEILHNIKCYFSLKTENGISSEAFFVRSDGRAFTQYDVTKVVKMYMTRFSNADKISPHVFRHSFATHMLNDGADINAIKELLGHADLTATEVYTHVSRQHLKETYKHTHPRELKKE